MVKSVSQLLNPLHGLWRIDELVQRLGSQNNLTPSVLKQVEMSAYRAVHSGLLKSHDPDSSLHNKNPADYAPLVTVKEFTEWLNASGSQLKLKNPRRTQTKPKLAVTIKGNWKMQIQAEASRRFKALRASGANPTVLSILPDIVSWCSANNIRTDTGIIPTKNYLRTHVLGGKHWSPPP